MVVLEMAKPMLIIFSDKVERSISLTLHIILDHSSLHCIYLKAECHTKEVRCPQSTKVVRKKAKKYLEGNHTSWPVCINFVEVRSFPGFPSFHFVSYQIVTKLYVLPSIQYKTKMLWFLVTSYLFGSYDERIRDCYSPFPSSSISFFVMVVWGLPLCKWIFFRL